MKKTIFLAAILIAALGFTGCGGSDKGGDLKIDAKVENGANFNSLVDEVRAVGKMCTGKSPVYNEEGEIDHYVCDGYQDVIIASAPYKNGGFKITLPKKIDERLLEPISSQYDGITISNTNAKGTVLLYLCAYKSNVLVDALMYLNYNLFASEATVAMFFYLDSDVKVTGTAIVSGKTIIHDCNFKKGWNIAYTKANTVTGDSKTTTEKPSIDLKWYFVTDLSTIPTAPQKLPNMLPQFFK